MNSYKELTVWQKSILICTEIYKTTKGFPSDERYGLTSQVRRSAVSIPSNIAEGYRRAHRTEYIQFIRIAYGSGAELETQLIICKNIHYLNVLEYENLAGMLEEIMKMLNKLISSLQPIPYTPHPKP